MERKSRFPSDYLEVKEILRQAKGSDSAPDRQAVGHDPLSQGREPASRLQARIGSIRSNPVRRGKEKHGGLLSNTFIWRVLTGSKHQRQNGT
jgi:hypothetical protein